MRPRVFPAEDRHERSQGTHDRRASMRPRVFPAEDVDGDQLADLVSTRFNEAAGIPRGRRRHRPAARCHDRRASMRPRVFPAEDPRTGDDVRLD